MSFSEFIEHVDKEITWLKEQYQFSVNHNQEILAGSILDTIARYYDILKEVSKL